MSPSGEDGIPNVHFIIPQRLTSEEDCSQCFRQAFKSCADHLLKPKWIHEKQCQDINATKKDVFVFEKFEGSAFNYFKKLKCVVLGPRCVLMCLSCGEPIPRGGNTIFSMAMSGLIITSTGFEEDEKTSVSERVQFMGGTYVGKLLKTVTHVIVNSVKSRKYEGAIKLQLTCVTGSWVTAVWEATQERDIHASDDEFLVHKCKPFHNLHISLTNFRGSEKEKLKRAIEENGGIFSGNLVPDSTDLLIVAKTGGDKYKAAQEVGIPCVMASWVYSSVKQGQGLGISEFEFDKRDCSTPNSETRYLPDISTMSAIHPIEPYGKCTINETLLNDTVTSGTKTQPAPPSRGSSDNLEAVEKLDLKEAQKAGPFLDGCNIFLSGFPPAASDKLRRLLKYGQATKFNEISDSVSHVVVGNVVLSDMKALKACVTRPHVVTVDWLVESIKRCSPAPEEPFLCLDSAPAAAEPPSPSLKKGLQMLQARQDRTVPCVELKEYKKSSQKESEQAPDNLIPQYLNKNETFQDLGGGNLFRKDASVGKETRDQLSQAPSTFLSQTDTTVPVFFEGLQFLPVGFDSDVLEQLHEFITMNGGEIVGKKFLGVPDYAVVPFTGAVVHHACSEVVSHLWVEDCCDNGCLVPLEYYHYPVTVPENVKPLTGCVIGVTSYVGRERDYIIKLSEVLGAIAQDVLSKKDSVEKNARASTHLICREPGSQKYNAAIKWKLPAVTHEWVLACLGERRRVSLEPYLVGASTVPDNELYDSSKSIEPLPIPVEVRQSNTESFAVRDSRTPTFKEPAKIDVMRVTSKETCTPVSSRSHSKKSCLEMVPMDVSLEETKQPACRTRTPVVAAASRTSEEMLTPPATDIRPGGAAQNSSLHTPMNVSSHYGFSQETPLNISRFGVKTSSATCLRRAALAPKPEAHHTANVDVTTPTTPKPPGYIDTPETPYGLGPNPSPETRKNWKRWINKFPNLKQDDPIPEKKRRDSTPLSELYRKCWSKFGAKHAEFNAENSPTLVPNDVKTKSASETDNPDTTKTAVRRLSIHDSPELTTAPVNSQVTATMGINTQLANLNELLASPRVQQPASMKRTSSALGIENSNRSEDSREKIAKFSREASVKEVAWTYDASQGETTKTYKFMLSTLELAEREKYSEIITRLDGTVLTSNNFDPAATHLISTKLSRSEKLLASIASGKWVLHKEFLDISTQHGCFSEEEHFEWGNPATLHPASSNSLDTDLAKACHFWRKKLSESGRGGAFKGFRAIMATDPAKAAPLTRLVLAGGGTISNAKAPFTDPDGATHCFIEVGKISFAVDLESLVEKGVWCLPPIYLSNYLMQNPLPDPAACEIMEAKSIKQKSQAFAS